MEKEIKIYIDKEIRSEFSNLKSEQDKKWEEFTMEILEKIKPPFSVAQLITWLFSFLGTLVVIVTFVVLIKFKSDRTAEDLEKHEILKANEAKELNYKIDKMFDLVTITNNTVIELKTKAKIDDTRNEQYQKTKRFTENN